jgi:glycosyltransferase involved in cell wall biosynthesis
VIFTGARTDVEKILNIADVFVGVSRAALEAMATELPIILVGNPEYGQGYQGVFVPEELDLAKSTNFTCRGLEVIDKEELKKDILQILVETDDETRIEMGKYNRSIVEEHYSVEKMTEDALELYKF